MAYFRRCGCVGVALLAVVTAAKGDDDELKPFLEKVVAAVGGEPATGVKAWTQTYRLKINAIKVKGSVVYRDFVELPDRFRQETEFEGKTLVKKTTCVIVGDKGWAKVGRRHRGRRGLAAESRRDRRYQVEGPGLRRHRPADPAPPGDQGVAARRVQDRRPGRRRRAGRPHRPGRSAERLGGAAVLRQGVRPPGPLRGGEPVQREGDGHLRLLLRGRQDGRPPTAVGKAPATDYSDPNLELEVIEFKLADKLDPKLFERLVPPPRTAETVAVEWVKERGRVTRANGSVVGVSLINAKVTDAELKELAPLNDLRKLELDGNEITGAGLKHLAPLEKLEELDLSRTSVGDAGLKELAPFRELRSLDLWNAQVTDAGLKHLAPLTKLRSLNLWNAQVTDAGLKDLAPLKGLQSLNLTNTQVTDAGLKELAPLEDLRSLDLSGTRVTDAGLKEVARHKGLESLSLTNARVTDAWLAALAPLEHLRELNLWHTQVTDAGLKEVARHKEPAIAQPERDGGDGRGVRGAGPPQGLATPEPVPHPVDRRGLEGGRPSREVAIPVPGRAAGDRRWAEGAGPPHRPARPVLRRPARHRREKSDRRGAEGAGPFPEIGTPDRGGLTRDGGGHGGPQGGVAEV